MWCMINRVGISPRQPIGATTVAVIGSAGGRGAAARLDKATWDAMCKDAELVIAETFGLNSRNVYLVSGGAAWADHVAVRLFLSGNFAGLVLHFPTKWLAETATFRDSGGWSWIENPGRVANANHRRFSAAIGAGADTSLREIELARRNGALVLDHYKGFHMRNLIVAKAAYLVAYSFSEGNAPTEGGTRHTWTHCTGRKVHRPIAQLLLRRRRQVSELESEDKARKPTSTIQQHNPCELRFRGSCEAPSV